MTSEQHKILDYFYYKCEVSPAIDSSDFLHKTIKVRDENNRITGFGYIPELESFLLLHAIPYAVVFDNTTTHSCKKCTKSIYI